MSANDLIHKKLAAFVPDDKKHIFDEIAKRRGRYISGEPTFKPTYWAGYRFLPGFESETAKYVFEEKEFEEDCVVIASFPKTGTTWTTQIVIDILYGHDEKLREISKLLMTTTTYLEYMQANRYEVLGYLPLPRRVYATHLPEELVNVKKITQAKGKFICIRRNPKDQAVSFFNFSQFPMFESIREEIPSTWPEFLKTYTSGKLPLISKEGEWYPDYLLGWHRHRNNPNFLFIDFEDMKKDCNNVIRHIASFLQVDLPEERVNEIAERNSIDAMKKDASDKGKITARSVMAGVGILRKGQVGTWKEIFTVSQSEEIDRIMEEKLRGSDIKFIYDVE